MTCPCHDPVVFGHLTCERWETQPRGRQRTATLPEHGTQARASIQAMQALSEALRAAAYSCEDAATAWNHHEARESTRNRATTTGTP